MGHTQRRVNTLRVPKAIKSTHHHITKYGTGDVPLAHLLLDLERRHAAVHTNHSPSIPFDRGGRFPLVLFLFPYNPFCILLF